uniref:Uncharacterized protein n=1 Tax=Solanum tuberosum TaxID=4113 RepID=M1DUV1_SOLTU
MDGGNTGKEDSDEVAGAPMTLTLNIYTKKNNWTVLVNTKNVRSNAAQQYGHMEVMRNEEINPVMEAKETNDSGKILQVMQSSNGINHGRKTTQELQHQRKLQWLKGEWVIRVIR